MELERIVISLIIYIGLFHLINYFVSKNNNSFNVKIISSYLLFALVLVVSIGSLIENKDRLIWSDLTINLLFFSYITI